MLIFRRSKLYFYGIWYRHSLWTAVQCTGWERAALHGRSQRVTYQMLQNTILTSWRWAYYCSKHVEVSNVTHILQNKGIVHQVGNKNKFIHFNITVPSTLMSHGVYSFQVYKLQLYRPTHFTPPYACYMSRPSSIRWFHLRYDITWQVRYKICSSIFGLSDIFHPVIYCFLGPNNLSQMA
jgi:hypothetical protein